MLNNILHLIQAWCTNSIHKNIALKFGSILSTSFCTIWYSKLIHIFQIYISLTIKLFYFIKLVDGGFTIWSNWSECSMSCGGEKKNLHRNCTNPSSSEHGLNCNGNTSEQRKCNENPCPSKINYLLTTISAKSKSQAWSMTWGYKCGVFWQYWQIWQYSNLDMVLKWISFAV